MPQLQLPIFPDGTKEINRDLGVQYADGKVVYLHGHLPVFQHEENDLKSFRLFTSQLVASGVARAREVVEAFGVPLGTVKRYAGLYRREGPSGFYQSKPRQRSETKLTPAIKEQAQTFLSAGCSVAEVARQTGVLATTLHKAIRAKRLPGKKKSRR
jgi:DNA invertase Pin-like site-specific DNA recombinase